MKQNDPYIWHAVLIDEVKNIYDQTIWGLRGAVWDIEKYQKELGKFQPQFLLLHDIARHISHSKEILDVALDTVDSAIHDYSMLNEQQPNSSSESACNSRKIQRQLYFASKSIRSTRFRCISLSERLQNEITLAFNIVSQRDSEVSVQLAKHSLSDNTMMKTVAIVSMVYLPGTFVSGIFGMNFFEFNTAKKSLNVSNEFWLYWLVTIALTLTTTCLWALCLNRDAIKHFLKMLTLVSKKPQGRYSTNAA
ncbi:hypothetical protein N7447_001567 [Penicillium robsamsonii]|uniref:uncharacterized protein n=1 Tax=Penicillium robsamsonii TaxID=1792511 RepID=UPI0025479B64|nr:uncharacterized protein N7447_001567 [Penicillium robsamsonii]KAJ5835541.1 hypothetical protein N7447_001567 [Penicillium robsamsonii]